MYADVFESWKICLWAGYATELEDILWFYNMPRKTIPQVTNPQGEKVLVNSLLALKFKSFWAWPLVFVWRRRLGVTSESYWSSILHVLKVSIMEPLARLYAKVGNSSFFNLSTQGRIQDFEIEGAQKIMCTSQEQSAKSLIHTAGVQGPLEGIGSSKFFDFSLMVSEPYIEAFWYKKKNIVD